MHSVFTLYKMLGGTGVKKDLVLCFQKMIVCIFRIHLWLLCLLKALLLHCVQLFTQAAFLLKLSVYQVFFSQGASYLNEKPHNILPVGCFFLCENWFQLFASPRALSPTYRRCLQVVIKEWMSEATHRVVCGTCD